MKLLVVLALVATLSLIDAKPRPDSLVVDFQRSQASRRVSDYVKECEDGQDYPVKVINFAVSPDPPKINQKVSPTITYSSSEEVTDGVVETALEYKTTILGIPVTVPVDLWNGKTLEEVLKEFGFQGPIEKTDGKTTSSEFELPSIVINSGTLKGTVRAKDQDGVEALCVTVNLPIEK